MFVYQGVTRFTVGFVVKQLWSQWVGNPTDRSATVEADESSWSSQPPLASCSFIVMIITVVLIIVTIIHNELIHSNKDGTRQ